MQCAKTFFGKPVLAIHFGAQGMQFVTTKAVHHVVDLLLLIGESVVGKIRLRHERHSPVFDVKGAINFGTYSCRCNALRSSLGNFAIVLVSVFTQTCVTRPENAAIPD